MPIIYGSLLSPYVRKVLMTLQLKNITYDFQELHPLREDHQPKLRQLNPLGKIPIYQENDFTISDSSAICAYLDKQYPQCNIFPTAAHDYAKSLWYEEYSDTQLTPTIIAIFVNKITALKLNVPPDNQALKHALEVQLPVIFDYLDHEIRFKKYFMGHTLSIADISISSALMSYQLLHLTIDKNRWMNLNAYMHTIFSERVIYDIFQQTKKVFKEKYGDIALSECLNESHT